VSDSTSQKKSSAILAAAVLATLAASQAATAQEAVSAPPGDATWPKPDGFGKEIALYIRRSAAE